MRVYREDTERDELKQKRAASKNNIEGYSTVKVPIGGPQEAGKSVGMIKVKPNVQGQIKTRPTMDPAHAQMLKNAVSCQAPNCTYKAPISDNPVGEPLNISPAVKTLINFPITKFVTLTDSNVDSFVFVLVADKSVYNLLTNVIATIHLYFPKKQIVLYDIGLEPSQNMRMKTVCNMAVKDYKPVLAKLPKHVAHPKLSNWKALIIHDALQTANGVFYLDNYARLTTSDFSRIFESILKMRL